MKGFKPTTLLLEKANALKFLTVGLNTYVLILDTAENYAEAEHIFDEMLLKGIRPKLLAVVAGLLESETTAFHDEMTNVGTNFPYIKLWEVPDSHVDFFPGRPAGIPRDS